MKRCIMGKLVAWKQKKNRKPLVLKGARQVGKTWIMKEFGKAHFKHVAYINFQRNSRMEALFENDFDIENILMAINIETGVPVIPEETLLIFDEIQSVPRALTALKYFCEEAPEYPLIAAGSLLGIALHSGVSFPVGKVSTLELYPMNFREFLLAMGEDGLEKLLSEKNYALMPAFADKYTHWLKLYYYIGGMPEVVASYAEEKDIVEVRRIQKEILDNYEDDFGNHIPEDILPKIRMVWNAVPMQLAKENKKFFFGQIKTGARAKDFEEAIEWLRDCGLVHQVLRVSKPQIPLKAYREFSVFKLFFVDVGLLGAMGDLEARTILEGSDIFVEFKGALAEQYVLQEMLSETEYQPYYYSASSHNEIDFLIQHKGNVVPLEVKAEVNVRSRSLRAYHEKFQPPYTYRFSMQNYRDEGWLVNVPLYAVSTI